jgi:hypothetical protein
MSNVPDPTDSVQSGLEGYYVIPPEFEDFLADAGCPLWDDDDVPITTAADFPTLPLWAFIAERGEAHV